MFTLPALELWTAMGISQRISIITPVDISETQYMDLSYIHSHSVDHFVLNVYILALYFC